MTPDEPPLELGELLRAAWERRAPLHADPSLTTYRAFHGHGEGCPGLSVDRFGGVFVITHHPEHEPWLERVAEALEAICRPECVIARLKRGRGAPRVLRGAAPPEAIEVLDTGLRFWIEPLARRSWGLYLDARPARQWLRDNAQDRRVLNLFAYTGSLGIACAAGGARSVLHVELQKRALRRIEANLILNGLRVDKRDLVREDLYRYLRRAGRQGRQLGGIVLDPPPRVPGRGVRAEGQDYETLIPLVTPLLAPDAWLLCFFSRLETTHSEGEARVLEHTAKPLEVLWRGTSGIDFPEADPAAKLAFTAFAAPAEGSATSI